MVLDSGETLSILSMSMHLFLDTVGGIIESEPLRRTPTGIMFPNMGHTYSSLEYLHEHVSENDGFSAEHVAASD